MAKSYKKIDYRVRPAKNIERKMFIEAFRRLSEFGSVDGYRYVGFGSVFFSDFALFHRALGFEHMISIEVTTDPVQQRRFELNAPFGCVKVKFGHSKDVLPQLPWGMRSIVWLDYDGSLVDDVLSDISLVCSQACQGTVLIVSVNASAITQNDGHGDGDKPLTPLEMLKENVSSEKVPGGITNQALAGWGMSKACRSIIHNEIEESLKYRNGGLPKGSRFKYRQLFNFQYEDGAKMLTVGGILHDEGQEHIVDRCAFDKLSFYRPDETPYKIEPPLLTFKEVRALDKLIPIENGQCELPLPPSDVAKYEKYYRYFPHFAEAEI